MPTIWEVDNPWYRRGPVQLIAGRLVWRAGRCRHGRWSYTTVSVMPPKRDLESLLVSSGLFTRPRSLAGLVEALAPRGMTLEDKVKLAWLMAN